MALRNRLVVLALVPSALLLACSSSFVTSGAGGDDAGIAPDATTVGSQDAGLASDDASMPDADASSTEDMADAARDADDGGDASVDSSVGATQDSGAPADGGVQVIDAGSCNPACTQGAFCDGTTCRAQGDTGAACAHDYECTSPAECRSNPAGAGLVCSRSCDVDLGNGSCTNLPNNPTCDPDVSSCACMYGSATPPRFEICASNQTCNSTVGCVSH